MSLEKSDSDSVRSSASVVGPLLTLAVVSTRGGTANCGFFVVVVGNWEKKLCGLGVGPMTAPGGLPHAFGTDGGPEFGKPRGRLLGATVGRAGNSSCVVFFGAAVEVGCCWPGSLLPGGVGKDGKSSFFFGAKVVVCCRLGDWGTAGGGPAGGNESGRAGTGGGGGLADVSSCFVGLCGLGGGVTESDLGGNLGAVATLLGFTVVVVVWVWVAAFLVVVGCSVVVSLSLDLNKPVNPLKNPFFLVVDSGSSVVVVVRWIGGKGLKSDCEYANALIWLFGRFCCWWP